MVATALDVSESLLFSERSTVTHQPYSDWSSGPLCKLAITSDQDKCGVSSMSPHVFDVLIKLYRGRQSGSGCGVPLAMIDLIFDLGDWSFVTKAMGHM